MPALFALISGEKYRNSYKWEKNQTVVVVFKIEDKNKKPLCVSLSHRLESILSLCVSLFLEYLTTILVALQTLLSTLTGTTIAELITATNQI